MKKAICIGAMLAFGLSPAAAEPKNQIVVPSTCDDGGSYTFVINGSSKTGQLVDTNSNIKITSYVANYYDMEGNFLGSESHSASENLNARSDVLTCHGEVNTTLQKWGEVRAVYDFKGFITPVGGR